MDSRLNTVRNIVRDGIQRNEIKPDIDPDTLASFIIASLEGAILLKMLYRDTSHMRRTIAQLYQYIEGFVRA